MELMQAMQARRSCRKYKADCVPREVLEQIVAAGQTAPVGMRAYDSVHISVVTDSEALKQISETAGAWGGRPADAVLYGVPALIVVSAKDGDPTIPSRPEDPLTGVGDMNAACMVQNMLLAATDLGLGSVFMFGKGLGLADAHELRARIGIPEGFSARAAAAVGYPEDDSAPRANATPFGVDWI